MTRPRVVVVGAGLAGLAAAIRASDDGADVEVLERAPRLGGATWSFTRDELILDNGQHVFMRCCTAYRAFLDRVGSAEKVTLQRRMDVPVRDRTGEVHRLTRNALPAPFHLATALARYRHMSVRDRIDAARTGLALRGLDLADDRLDQQTFADWLFHRGVGAEAIDALWDLVCLPTVNLHARDASLLLAAKVFKTGLFDNNDGGDIGWSNVPLKELHADAAARVLSEAGAEVRMSAPVTAVASTSDGAPVVMVGDETRPADAVIVAVPHDVARTLLPTATFDHQDEIDGLGRSPIVNVHLLYDRKIVHEQFVAGLNSPIQFVFDRTEPSGAPPGTQCVAISLSAADDLLAVPSRALVDRFTTEMESLFPESRGATVLTSMVTREVAATFRGVPGTSQMRPGPATRLPGVFLAGAWTDTGWPATMEGAVRSGNAAADAVRRHLAVGHPAPEGVAA